jgi:hypothetical protein
MRSKWMITSVVLFMLVAVSGYAQTARAMRITVPFQFSIHDQVLAAGDYLVSQANTNGVTMFSVQSAEDGHAFYVLGNAISKNDELGSSSAVFHRYGTSYFLADIWWGGRFASGVDVPESKTERELANTASLSRPDQVVLLASR